MTRPDQHPDIEKALRPFEGAVGRWRLLCHAVLCPPNLMYAGSVLQRLAQLSLEFPEVGATLPRELSEDDGLTRLLQEIQSASENMPTDLQMSIYASANEGSRRALSPLYRYGLSTFPVWCALVVRPEDPSAAAGFDAILADALAVMVSHIESFVSASDYVEFRNRWHGRAASGSDNSLDHPLGAKRSAFCDAERQLRGLSSPAHHVALSALSAAAGIDDAITTLEEDTSEATSETLNVLKVLRGILDRLGTDRSRSDRRYTQLRNARGPVQLTQGQYLSGMTWLIHDAEPSDDGTIAQVQVNQRLVDDVERFLREDFALDELVDERESSVAIVGDSGSSPAAALRVISKYEFHAQQERNQLLRWNAQLLTAEDLRTALGIIVPVNANYEIESDDTLLARLCYAGSLNTGLALSAIRDELLIREEFAATCKSRVEYLLSHRQFRLTVNRPAIQTVQLEEEKGDVSQRGQYLYIPDRVGMFGLAEAWFKRHGERLTSRPQDRKVDSKNSVVLALRQAGIRDSQIEQFIGRTVLAHTGDEASIALWGDWAPGHCRVLRHYLSPLAEIVETQIREALTTAVMRAKALNEHRFMKFVPASEPIRHDRRIGAPDFPEREEVQRLTQGYRDKLSSAPLESLDDMRAYSNTYISYYGFLLSAALGYRAAIDPAPEFLWVGERLFAVFSDKDSGYHRRIVLCPGILREHLAFVQAHLRLIATVWRLGVPEVRRPTLTWLIDGKGTPMRPKDVARDAGPLWTHRMNALRRRMRTLLYERGADGETANVWMGHWMNGTCPLAEGSGFQCSDLSTLVREHIEPILEADGWVAIPSRLTEGLLWNCP